MEIQFIKNYFRNYNNIQFRKHNIIPASNSNQLNAYLYYTKYNLYIIPKDYVKEV